MNSAATTFQIRLCLRSFFLFLIITVFCSSFLSFFSGGFAAFADDKEIIEISDKAIFLNEKPEYKSYIRDMMGVFGSGWSYTIYGSYSQGAIRFSHDDFENLTVGEFAETGVGDFTNEKVEPFITYFWQPEIVGEPDTNFIAVSLMNEANADTDNKFLSFCFEPGGKVVFMQYNEQVLYAENDGVMEAVSQNGFVTDFAPRLNVNSYFEGHSALPYNVLRLYVDYQANKFYMANGEDASVNNGKLIEFDVDWSLCEDLSLVRVIPYTVNNFESGFSFMVKELMGKPVIDAYAVIYGNLNDKYATNSVLKTPKCDIMINDNDFSAEYYVSKGDNRILVNADGTFMLAEKGEYVITYYYEMSDAVYVRHYSFTVVDKTIVNVAAPVPSFITGKREDGLPAITGDTKNGIYRWKSGQVVREGIGNYEWEFIPFDDDPTIEYKDANGVIELTFSQGNTDKNNGCGGMIDATMFWVVCVAFTVFYMAKKMIKK